jgi:hypothetical protein
MEKFDGSRSKPRKPCVTQAGKFISGQDLPSGFLSFGQFLPCGTAHHRIFAGSTLVHGAGSSRAMADGQGVAIITALTRRFVLPAGTSGSAGNGQAGSSPTRCCTSGDTVRQRHSDEIRLKSGDAGHGQRRSAFVPKCLDDAAEENGAPERIRTSDPQIRSLVLYPAELRARTGSRPGGRERRGRLVRCGVT